MRNTHILKWVRNKVGKKHVFYPTRITIIICRHTYPMTQWKHVSCSTPYQVPPIIMIELNTWWRHQMETFSALLAICAENSPVPGEFFAQRPVPRSFDVFFDLRKQLSKQWWGWWFETLSHPLWHRNELESSSDACIHHVSPHITFVIAVSSNGDDISGKATTFCI